MWKYRRRKKEVDWYFQIDKIQFSQMATCSGCLLYLKILLYQRNKFTYLTLSFLQLRILHLTSSHSAPWKTTRLSHSLHLDGARSFLSLWVWAALDIWAFLNGPGELAVSVTISARPEKQEAPMRKLIRLVTSYFVLIWGETNTDPLWRQSEKSLLMSRHYIQ